MNKNGIHIEFHENGKKKSEENFKDGKLDGLYTWWYENGQKEAEGTYKDGKKDGLWTGWYENGQKYSEATFKDGKVVRDTEDSTCLYLLWVLILIAEIMI